MEIHGTFILRFGVFRTLWDMPNDTMTFTYTPGQREGVMILKLDGPLTLSTMFSFQGEFRAMTPPLLIVDLAGTPYMDSAGLGVLMNAYVSANTHGRQLLLAATNDRIKALLELTKVDALLKSYPTVEEAEAGV